MLRPRIIPCLLVHQGGLVKTVEFDSPKYVGDPINAVKIFNEKEADELIVVDIDATIHGVEPNFKQIANLAAECRMPLCYGGGIKSTHQARTIIGLGVEKVAISSAFIETPNLISNTAQEIGSQSVVVVLDVKRNPCGIGYEVWTHHGKKNSKRCPIQAAQEAESIGAGEIVINSIEKDGRMNGYDLALASRIRDAVRLPVTILGGAGSLAHLQDLVEACGIIGAAAGSLFVFKGPYKAVLINYPNQTQKDGLIASSLLKA